MRPFELGSDDNRQVAPPWLTKSDLMNYARCDQGFVLQRTGAVSDAADVGTAARAAIDAGGVFDRAARAGASPIVDLEGRPAEFAELIGTDRFIVCDILFVNDDKRFAGIPDGLNMAHGALEPLEIKNRAGQRDSDIIELAFYWLLLSPHRLVAAEPTGWLQLRGVGGEPCKPYRVPIPAPAIAAVLDLAVGAREALAAGVTPRWCECPVCSQYSIELTPQVRRSAPVRLVNGLGPRRSRELVGGRIETLGDLVDTPAESVRALFDFRAPSVETVRRWQSHATALIDNMIERRPGAHGQLPSAYIAFDLEYRPESPSVIWALCAQTVGTEQRRRLTVFDDGQHQSALIDQLARFLGADTRLPLVSWNGTSADLPMLRKVLAQADPAPISADALLSDMTVRHIDLLYWTKSAFVLPIPGLSLKAVADYFGARDPGNGASGNGFWALQAWQQYLITGDETVRDQLIDYNRNDVALLVRVAETLRDPDLSPSNCEGPRGWDSDEIIVLEERVSARPRPRGRLRRAFAALRRQRGLPSEASARDAHSS
nr:ribonuclease H-like domain-containing protein [Rhodococcus sp. (in: high G+C Gram-positive bacteria)]